MHRLVVAAPLLPASRLPVLSVYSLRSFASSAQGLKYTDTARNSRQGGGTASTGHFGLKTQHSRSGLLSRVGTALAVNSPLAPLSPKVLKKKMSLKINRQTSATEVLVTVTKDLAAMNLKNKRSALHTVAVHVSPCSTSATDGAPLQTHPTSRRWCDCC